MRGTAGVSPPSRSRSLTRASTASPEAWRWLRGGATPPQRSTRRDTPKVERAGKKRLFSEGFTGDFHAFSTRLEVLDQGPTPPYRRVGWSTRKVQGPTHPSGRVGWTFQTVQGPCGGGPVRWGGVLQSDVRMNGLALAVRAVRGENPHGSWRTQRPDGSDLVVSKWLHVRLARRSCAWQHAAAAREPRGRRSSRGQKKASARLASARMARRRKAQMSTSRMSR